MIKLHWTRWPSVNRNGRFFYTTALGDIRYWVVQNWRNSLWSVEDSCGAVWGKFATAKEARQAVENM
jgi:hypothetical protein